MMIIIARIYEVYFNWIQNKYGYDSFNALETFNLFESKFEEKTHYKQIKMESLSDLI